FGQLDHRLVGDAGEHHVFQAFQLLADARVDARVGVAEDIHPPGADRIQVTFAVEVLQPDTGGLTNRYQGQAFVILHLGAGVPQHVEVALHPVVVQTHEKSPSVRRHSLSEACTETGRVPMVLCNAPSALRPTNFSAGVKY